MSSSSPSSQPTSSVRQLYTRENYPLLVVSIPVRPADADVPVFIPKESSDDWLFLPPTIQPSSKGGSTPSVPSSSAPQPPLLYVPPARGGLGSGPNVVANLGLKDALKVAAGAFLLQFTSTAMAMPFEVSKVLLQIQYCPRPSLSTRAYPSLAPEPSTPKEFGGSEGSLSDEEDAQAYFQDLMTAPSRLDGDITAGKREVDADGYVVKRVGGGTDEDEEDEWVMRSVKNGSFGVRGMMTRIWRSKEGVTGLWKGQLTTYLIDILNSFFQPIIHNTLISFIQPNPSPTSAALPQLLTLSASHVITGVLFSPLDLARTRLIAQSSLKPHRKYSGLIPVLKDVVENEGGWRGLYFHPTLLIPTLLDTFTRSFLSLSIPYFIERQLNVSAISTPVVHSLLTLTFGMGSLLVTLPLETVRRRLQVQSRASITTLPEDSTAVDFKTCVDTRPRRYIGVVESIWRILTEEVSPASKASFTPSGPEPLMFAGISQLYRGFGMGVGASSVVFLLSLVGEGVEVGGWQEI